MLGQWENKNHTVNTRSISSKLFMQDSTLNSEKYDFVGFTKQILVLKL